MPSPEPAPLTFYKAYCFRSLSPTYNEWARLAAVDVHALRERPEFEGHLFIPETSLYHGLIVYRAADILPAQSPDQMDSISRSGCRL